MNVAYQNFSDVDSKPLTGRIKQGIFTLVLKEITFIVGVTSSFRVSLSLEASNYCL